MDVTTITAALDLSKTLLGLARGAASAAVDHALKDKLIDIQQGILDVQAKLGDAQAERLDLLNEVAELREKLRAAEATQVALDAYELCQLAEGKYLYKSRADAGHSVEHYACPSCHNRGRVSILQGHRTGSQQTHYICSDAECRFSLYVGPSDPIQRRRAASPYVPRGW